MNNSSTAILTEKDMRSSRAIASLASFKKANIALRLSNRLSNVLSILGWEESINALTDAQIGDECVFREKCSEWHPDKQESA